MINYLILPIGGSATRLLGLPKYLLPYNSEKTLIEMHIEGALKSGYEKCILIVNNKYSKLTADFISSKSSFQSYIQLIELDRQTKTMNETLLSLPHRSDFNHTNVDYTVGLSDSAFVGEDYASIYGKLMNVDGVVLSLFAIRASQHGKLGQVEVDDDFKVVSIVDKDLRCNFPYIWGIAKFDGSFFLKCSREDAHIGISLAREINFGMNCNAILNDSSYFDCGTLSEYRDFLNASVVA